jgi:thiamine-phosphate pyrophosphorylase
MDALRTRVYPILDTATLARRGCDPVSFAEAILDGGARLLQFRHKDAYTREAYARLERVAELCGRYDAELIVNDRADLAAIVDAGLHVGQDDLPPRLARRVIGARTLGLSTHNEAQLRAAADEPVDYVALGPIFATESKATAEPSVGLDHLKAWRALTARPLVAIGGITLDNAARVIEAGADAVALIGALLPETIEASAIRARMETWIQMLR